jgi:hypothetical protein
MADQPYWDPANKRASYTLSDSDRSVNATTSDGGSAYATAAPTSGKYYVEMVPTVSLTQQRWGVNNTAATTGNFPGNTVNHWVLAVDTGNKRTNSSSVAYGTAASLSDVMMMAVDVGAGKVWWGRNGTWYNSGDPAAGTGEAYSGLPSTVEMCWGKYSTGSTQKCTLTVLASYAYSPPSGFAAGWGGATSVTFNQSLSATLATAATIRKSVQKRLSATLTATATIRKTVQKRLSAALPMAATLARIALRPVALVAGMAMTASMRRQVHKGLSATLSATGTIIKSVAKGMSATCTLTGSIAKAFPVHLVASLTATASMTRTIYKILSGSLPMTGVLGKIKAVVVNMSASLGMTAAMRASTLFIRSLSASITLSATVQRTISKMLSAPLPVIARPIAWVASMFAATRHDKPNWNQCARCWRKQRPNKMQQQMEYRGPRLVWTGLYVCHTCLDDPQPQEIWPRETGGDPKPVILARPRRD